FCIREHALQRAEYKIVDLTAIAKTHFELLRMSVDVDELRIEREIENIGSMTAAVEHIAIGEAHRVHQQPVAYIAVVDEPELLVRLRARGGRQTYPTGDVDRTGRVIHRHAPRRELFTQNFPEAHDLLTFGYGRGVENQARPITQPGGPMGQTKGHVESRQREPFDQPRDVSKLRRVAAHEFASRRDVEEQV